MNIEGKKCLIAYFSRKGENYVSGNIADLSVGNTEIIAKYIQNKVGGDLFHIEAEKTYPKDYTETTKVAQDELRKKARPELTEQLDNMKSYEVVFLGYPNWWGTMPMPVFTFLESYDFTGKIIVPFCTHEGSGLSHSESDIAKTCSKAKLLTGIAITGSTVGSAKAKVSSWIDNLNF